MFFSLFMKRQQSISPAFISVIAIPHVQLLNWHEDNGRLFLLFDWNISLSLTLFSEKFKSMISPVQDPTKATLSFPTPVLGLNINVPFEIKVI